MGELIKQPGPGISRRDFLTGAGGLAAGALLTFGGERLLADDSAAEALEARILWNARERVLKDLFYTGGFDNPFYDPSLDNVAVETMPLGVGATVRAFPTSRNEFEFLATDESGETQSMVVSNGETILRKPLTVENPILLNYDDDALFTDTGKRWMLIDGPEGAGYVQCSVDDFSQLNAKEIFSGPFSSGRAQDGKLRFIASGFAWDQDSSFSSVFFDFHSTEGSGPDLKALGEHIKDSDYVYVSRTVGQP